MHLSGLSRVCFLVIFSAVAFGTTPQVANVTPASGPTGTQIQVTGSGFGATQGTSTLSVAGFTATVVNWSDTQITAVVPTAAVTGYVWVTVGSVTSNLSVRFDVPPPQITGISPNTGAVGTQVTITGSGFQSSKGMNSWVTFNGVTATVISWSDTQIVASVAAHSTTGTVTVYVNNVSSNVDQIFTMPNPVVTGLTPSAGPIGTVVQINGIGFGAAQGGSTIQFNGVNAAVTSWADTSITTTVPVTATSGPVAVTVGGVTTASNIEFTIPPPHVSSVTPSTGVAGTQITVTGSGFQAAKGTNTITVNGYTATTTSWSDTQIVATVAAGTTTGPVSVRVNSIPSNQDVLFTVTNPIVTAISPTSGPVGTQVQISGTGFGATQGSSRIQFPSSLATPVVSWSDTQIVATVPGGASSGYVRVTVSNVTSPATMYFTVPPPHVTGVSPAAGAVGTQITITGTGFGDTQTQGGANGSSAASVNGTSATIVSWSDTQIVATVRAGSTTGPVTVDGFAGNSNKDVVFTMANPIISSISPSTGPVGTQIQINGTGFGATQGSSTLQLYSGAAAGIVSWSDTLITATVPAAATSGSVTVTEAGVSSNTNIKFTVPPPQITSISPTAGVVGTQLTITGSGFQSTKGSSSIALNGTVASVISWSDSQIVASAPAVTGINPVIVTVNNVQSNRDLLFTMPNPVISAIAPGGAPVGSQVQISGSGFGATQGNSTLQLNSLDAPIVSWSDTLITATVPAGSATGAFYLTVGGIRVARGFTVSNLNVNNFSPLGGSAGTAVTISGTGFGSSQGTSTIAFNGVNASVSSWSDTQIVATVPAGAASGPIRATVGSSSSYSAQSFNVGSIVVSSVNPVSGELGSQIQVNGSGFGASQGSSTVTINGFTATASAWSDTQITATVPTSATTGPIRVYVGGVSSNSTVSFTVIGPVVTSVSPSSGPVGTAIQVNGSGFGATQGSSRLMMSGTVVAVSSWSDSSITATVPTNVSTGSVYVLIGSTYSNTNVYFTVPTPQITGIQPSSGIVGTQVTITGTAFKATQGASTVSFNGYGGSVVSWGDTQIVAVVPASARTGPVTVNLNGTTPSNQDVIFSMPNPVVASLNPATGPMNTQVQISGAGFGATQGNSTLTFNNVAASPTAWSDTLITAAVPATATSGVVAVTVGGVKSASTISFYIPPPHVTSVTPNVGIAGTQITVAGTGFHATQGWGSVVFNDMATASIVSWSDTQVVATVPSNASTGGMTVSQNVYGNWDVEFSLISPSVTSISPTSGPVGTQVQINGSGFGATQGSSTVAFNGANVSPVSWSDTQIVAVVPSGSRGGPVTVNVAGVISNNTVNFTVPAPQITGIAPSSGTVGTAVTITGSGFQSIKGSSYVYFNGAATGTAVSWSDTQIVVLVPSGATTGAVKVVANNGGTSNQDFVFTMPNPVVTGVVPATGPTGTQVQINGTGFGAVQGGSSVSFHTAAATIVSWSDTQVVAIVPPSAISGPVQITEGGVGSNASIYFNVPAPTISSISPSIGGVGNTVTITGTGFQPTMGSNSYVAISPTTAAIKSWSDTQIVAVVPNAATTGSVRVGVNGVWSNDLTYTVPSLVVTSLSPNSGPVGTQVTVSGAAFGASQGTSVLTFNGQVASVSSWSDSQIIATVPVTAASGPAVVTVNGINSNTTVTFRVPPPYLSSFSPLGGVAGTQVTLNGTGFQAAQRDSTVTFNGMVAPITSWSDTQIVATVPAGATTGALLVTVNSISSSNDSFNVFEVPNPVITGVTPPEAPANGTITVTGSGFGTVGPTGQYPCWALSNCHLLINGVESNIQSWTDTSIIVQVGSSASTGPLTVVKYNATSNAVQFSVEGAPTVTGVSPAMGPAGSTVNINGTGFGSAQSTSTLQLNGTNATVLSWSDTLITATVPAGVATGEFAVRVAGIRGNGTNFVVNTTSQLTDSLGRTSSYTSAMIGAAWHNYEAQGSGCSSCTVRGTVHNDNDINGYLLDSIDELGRETSYTYDSSGNMASISRQLDSSNTATTSYTYNSFGEPLTVTDPLGNVTTNAYDANGNLTSVTSPAPAAGATASVTALAYDTKGELTTITDPLGHITTLTYNPVGLIASITDPQSNVTSYEYDLRGNRTAVVDALQNRTTFTYDLGNRLTAITYPDSTSVSFAYDSRGRRTSITDQNGKVTSYAYDDADRLTSVTDAALNVTTYAYDTENNLLSITDAAGNTTSFTYDTFGRVTQTTFPAVNSYETYAYDAVGNLTSKTDRKAQTIQYVYDALNRLTHKGYPDATGVDYVYDLAGKIKQVTDPAGTYGFAYDNMGRLIGTTTHYSFLPGVTYSNSYGYDAASNRTSFTAPDGSTVGYSYDTLNRLTSVNDSLTGQFGFGYDALSRRTSLTRPNGVNTAYSYDSLSRLLSVLHQAGTTTLDGAGYTYDNAGNRTTKTNYLNNITENYTYDPIYQLTQVTQGVTTTESYSYDAVGNRLSSLGMSPYVYNSSNELTSTPAAFTYDANGNTLTESDSSGTTRYTWDFDNRLASVTVPNVGTTSFRYDPFGRRIQKSGPLGTTNFLYDGHNVLEEIDNAGNLLARYTRPEYLDELLSQLRSGTTSYYHQDALRSVTSLSNGAGVLAKTYSFDSFGNSTASTGTLTNPFQYTGRDFDSETGLYFNRARYFDPLRGRFISEDPARFFGGFNFYTYVDNDPVDWTDPTGLKTYECTAPLHAAPKLYHKLPLAYHEYLCVVGKDGKPVCVGQDRSGSAIWSPGKPSNDTMQGGQCKEKDPDNQCIEQCILAEGAKPRPQYGIGPQGTDCQEWADDTLSKCEKQCGKKKSWSIF